MADTTRRQEKQDAPELGDNVWLHECTVDDLLPLFELAKDGNNANLILATLAASLRIDDEEVTEVQLRALGASKFRALMRLGSAALRINSIIPEEGEDEEKKD